MNLVESQNKNELIFNLSWSLYPHLLERFHNGRKYHHALKREVTDWIRANLGSNSFSSYGHPSGVYLTFYTKESATLFQLFHS